MYSSYYYLCWRINGTFSINKKRWKKMTEKGSFIPFSILKWVTWCNISALSQWATICWRLFPFKLSTSPYRGGGITTDSMQPGRNIRPADIPTPNHAHSWRKRESISEDLFLFIYFFFFQTSSGRGIDTVTGKWKWASSPFRHVSCPW